MTIDVGIYQGIEDLNILGRHSSALIFLAVIDTDPFQAYIYTRSFGVNYKRDRSNIHSLSRERTIDHLKRIKMYQKENKKSGKWTNTFLANPAKYINQLPLKSYRNEDERS